MHHLAALAGRLCRIGCYLIGAGRNNLYSIGIVSGKLSRPCDFIICFRGLPGSKGEAIRAIGTTIFRLEIKLDGATRAVGGDNERSSVGDGHRRAASLSGDRGRLDGHFHALDAERGLSRSGRASRGGSRRISLRDRCSGRVGIGLVGISSGRSIGLGSGRRVASRVCRLGIGGSRSISLSGARSIVLGCDSIIVGLSRGGRIRGIGSACARELV